MRFARLAIVFLSLFSPCAVYAQSTNASITGIIEDSAKSVIPDVSVTAINTKTGERNNTKTNRSGQYTISALTPGTYRVEVDKIGFRGVIEAGLTLHTQDIVQLNFNMAVGSTAETVTVNADDNNINTTDATVGTIIDRQFVENMPLNGRSFQSLILLSPGVVTATPQPNNAQGEFSVNGQRTDANNFMVDGVSANNSNSAIDGGAGPGGMTSSATALGTTQAIISVDAMEEFRIATSTYSAEFGRQPGAQISFQSRAGTNDYHGTAFDYIRNAVFDANNWFNTYSTPPTPKPKERQNDFGGVFGGPITIPALFSGKDRAFFFLSYEGLRLSQPQSAQVIYVPSNGTYNTATYANPAYKNLRANAPAAIQPILNAFPLPNCSIQQDPQCVDYGDGLSPLLASSISPSTINAPSGRLDFAIAPWMRLFLRYADTTSKTVQDPDSHTGRTTNAFRTRTFLVGVNSAFGASLTNELRLQYSPSFWGQITVPSTFGGGVPTSLQALAGLPPGGEQVVYFSPPSGEQARLYDQTYGTRQFQPNVVDTISWAKGHHLFKAGVDYRQTTSYMGDGELSRGPYIVYTYKSPASVLSNTIDTVKLNTVVRQDPTFKNLGIYVQDEWRATSRMSLSLGLRWDLNPPPSVSGAIDYTYAGDLANPSSVTLAPYGTPAYKTTYTNFAPRFGVAIQLHNEPGHELVFRGGGGLFYDTGQSLSHLFGVGYGLGAGQSLSLTAVSFPLPLSIINAPTPPPTPPYSLNFTVDRNFFPPSTIQWSASLEQAFGRLQSVIVGYVGSAGRNLSRWTEYDYGALNPNFADFNVLTNGPGSNYNSLQIQYKRRALRDLQVQASYTWSHAIDSASTDYYGGLPLQRGNSDQDVRNNFTAALVYNLPKQYAERWKRTMLGGWVMDMRTTERTGFPVQVQGASLTDPISGETYDGRLNYNGKNPYVHVAGIPGGRQFDPSVFSVPATAGGNGTAPRNFLRGFGEASTDVAIERVFPLYERINLRFRAESFNIFNHPNFGELNADCGTSTPGAQCNNSIMGQAQNTLSDALSGLASIYQQGGPRSMQFALKLQF